MNIKRRTFTLILFVFTAFAVPSMAVRTNAQSAKPPANKETKTEKLLKAIKASYTQFQGNESFVIAYHGKEKKQIDVIVIEAETMIVIVADAAAGDEITLTAEKMRKLLEYNNQVDYIKVGISDIGSIRVQAEQNLSVVNAKVLGEILDQVAAATDEVAKIIGPIVQKTTAK